MASPALEEIIRERERAADRALRSITSLRESLSEAEGQIRLGREGLAMIPSRCIPSHQYLSEVVEHGATFVAFWNASGMVDG